MPRRKKSSIPFSQRTTIDVSGMTVEDILKIDPEKINAMSDADLTAISKRLVSASNKRVRRLRASKSGKYSPALGDVPEKGFSVNFAKDKNHRNRVYEEFSKMREFMSRKTSTAKGWRELRKQFHERFNAPLDPEQSSAFWAGYRKFAQDNPALASRYGSERLAKIYGDAYDANLSEEELWDKLNDLATEYYEEAESIDNADSGSFFSDWDDEDWSDEF